MDLFLKVKTDGGIKRRKYPLELTNDGLKVRGMLLNQLPEKFDYKSNSGISLTKELLLRNGLALRCLQDAVNEGSFTKAAKLNNIKQSVVSLRIQKLERALGTILFVKKNAKTNIRVFPLELTDDGSKVLKALKQVPEKISFK